MSSQTYQKMAIFAMLVALVLALGLSQQALAQYCGYSGCYSYPQERVPPTEFVSSQNLSPDNLPMISGM